LVVGSGRWRDGEMGELRELGELGELGRKIIGSHSFFDSRFPIPNSQFPIPNSLLWRHTYENCSI